MLHNSPSESPRGKSKVIILIGPPGCGKGTQAERIRDEFKIPAISTGAMLRAEMQEGTELGKIAADIAQKGGLVGDDIINAIVATRLQKPDCEFGFLLDGYPRTVAQAEYLDKLLAKLGFPPPQVIHIDVPEQSIVDRITLRRQCPACGHIYNLKFHPPQKEGACDHDGAELYTRKDDNEQTVRARLKAYHESTAPLIDYYRSRAYSRVDGEVGPDEVFQAVQTAIKNHSFQLTGA